MVGGEQSGLRVLGELRRGCEEARSAAIACRQLVAQREDDAAQAVRERGLALLDLARHYLPEVSRPAIEATFHEVRGRLEGVLAKKQAREAEVRGQWEAALDERADLERQLDAATAELNALVAQREALERRLAEALQGDAEFQAASGRAIAAEGELARNTQRVAEARDEAARKLPAYERSALFKYLERRAFGTSDYKARGVTRALDRWVARLVNYRRAKQGYDFLRVTPELMAAEVQRRQAEFDGLMEGVEAIERRHSDELGLTATLTEGVKLGKQRDALVTRLEAAHAERARVERELQDLAGQENAFYAEAVGELQGFLGGLHQSTLDARAQRTPDLQDDRLVDRVRRAAELLGELQREVAELRMQDKALAPRASGLADVVKRFQQAEFDSERSVFHGRLNVQQAVQGVLSGELSPASLWSLLKEHQRFLPAWVEEQYPGPGRAADGEFAYVLMRVLAEVAGAAIEHSVRRGGGWGGGAPSGGWGHGGHRGGSSPTPRHSAPASPPSVRRPAGGGFTSGRGF